MFYAKSLETYLLLYPRCIVLFCFDGINRLQKGTIFASEKDPLSIPEGFLGGIQEGICLLLSSLRLAVLP